MHRFSLKRITLRIPVGRTLDIFPEDVYMLGTRRMSSESLPVFHDGKPCPGFRSSASESDVPFVLERVPLHLPGLALNVSGMLILLVLRCFNPEALLPWNKMVLSLRLEPYFNL